MDSSHSTILRVNGGSNTKDPKDNSHGKQSRQDPTKYETNLSKR